MTIIIENGSGVTGANSYCSVSYISSYCTLMGYTGFTGTTLSKEQSVYRGMAYLEAMPWKGMKVDFDYSLENPRSGVYDRNGYLLEDDEISPNIKKAEAEIVYREHISAKSMQPDLGNDDLPAISGIKKRKIDVLETEYFTNEERGSIYKRKYYTIIQGLLKGLIHDGSTIMIGRS